MKDWEHGAGGADIGAGEGEHLDELGGAADPGGHSDSASIDGSAGGSSGGEESGDELAEDPGDETAGTSDGGDDSYEDW